MKKVFIFFVSIALLSASLRGVNAQTPSPEGSEVIPTQTAPTEIPKDEYFQAKVVKVEDASVEDQGVTQPIQKVTLEITTGSEKGKTLEVNHGELFSITEDQKVSAGETIVLTKTFGPTGELYYITDQYRITPMFILFGLFFVLVVIFGRLKGVLSILGLLLSLVILSNYVVPQILAGANPLTTSLIGALAIAVLSIYLAHGLSKRTTIALASTVITLCIAAVLSLIYVELTSLTGTGSEEAIFLRMGPLGSIDLRGLLLGGIIIGTLGILDDITISQTSVIVELKNANSKLHWKKLFSGGIAVGRDHVSSLVNTLALAYVGASFPLLLLFSFSKDIPSWLTINSEFIAEEMVRTLVGSTALILAVPISTFLAAYFLGRSTPQVVPAKVTTKTKKAKKSTSKKKTS
jgi:uncharacterized membrane protein